MNPALFRTAALLSAMIAGALIPGAHVLRFLIPWLIVAMLFVVFLGTRFTGATLTRSHGWLLAANIAMGFAGFGLGWLAGGRDVALAGFFAGVAPTATAAVVVTGFLGGRRDYVAGAMVLTNTLISLLLPVLLPLVLGRATPRVIADVAGSVGFLVFMPMAAALVVRRVFPAARALPARLGNASFGAWILALFLITANASWFLRHESTATGAELLHIALVTVVVCALNFALGRLIGGRKFPREASQSLGQKNTNFTIYLAMTYASPLVALGPTCYVICHNLWNSWQLHRHGSRGDA
jgi:BASS family bile acid:Na+ symporter